MALSKRILDTLVQTRWRSMLDCLAQQLDMPVAMVNAIDGHDLLVAQVSDAAQRFRPGQRISLAVNSYCANVLRSGDQLFISDVRRLPALADCNPTASLGLVHYYGEPIHDADGTLVGTLCVMDSRPRTESAGIKLLVRLVRDAIQQEVQDKAQAEQLSASRQELQVAAQRFLDALERTGLGDAQSLRALGFSDQEIALREQLGRLTQRQTAPP